MRRTAVLIALVAGGVACGDAAAQQAVRVQDPGEGEVWSATASDTRGGRTCAFVFQGSARKGRYCETLGTGVPYAYNVRYETPPEKPAWRSVFTIVLSRQVTSATLSTPDGVRRYVRGRGPRVLLAVVAGRVEQPPLVVRVRGRGGRTLVARGGSDPAAEVQDPLGGPGWRTVVESRSARRACVSWQRVEPRYGGPEAQPSEGRFVCRDPGLTVVAARAEAAGGRVVVFGLVGPRVARVALRGPDDPPLVFDRASRSVLAVLPEGADPSSLRLVVTLADGRAVEQQLG